ncbi:hypothetical protein HDV00_009725 [Rhizophlyctis rosea]|nr:hypothetical protein HDV00_009725 [Rhizophlyctis rosea]
MHPNKIVEDENRLAVVRRWGKVLGSMHPSANTSLQVYGSTATGLYLPTSDVDVKITDRYTADIFAPGRSDMNMKTDVLERLQIYLADIRSQRGYEDPTLTNFIQTARTPIIKLMDQESGLPIDLSYGLHDRSIITKIQHLLTTIPYMESLTLLLKLIVSRVEDLDVPYHGGFGGLTLVVMVVCFMVETYSCDDARVPSLGVCFLGLLRYYHSFEFSEYLITIDGKLRKTKEQRLENCRHCKSDQSVGVDFSIYNSKPRSAARVEWDCRWDHARWEAGKSALLEGFLELPDSMREAVEKVELFTEFGNAPGRIETNAPSKHVAPPSSTPPSAKRKDLVDQDNDGMELNDKRRKKDHQSKEADIPITPPAAVSPTLAAPDSHRKLPIENDEDIEQIPTHPSAAAISASIISKDDVQHISGRGVDEFRGKDFDGSFGGDLLKAAAASGEDGRLSGEGRD